MHDPSLKMYTHKFENKSLSVYYTNIPSTSQKFLPKEMFPHTSMFPGVVRPAGIVELRNLFHWRLLNDTYADFCDKTKSPLDIVYVRLVHNAKKK